MTLRPGERLRAWAARMCSPDTMTRVIDPLIADLQVEHADAIARDDHRRARRIRFTGVAAFWKTMVVCEWRRSAPVALWTAGAAAATTMVFAVLLLSSVMQVAEHERAVWLLLLIAAQFVPVGITIGFPLAVVLTRTRRVLIAASVCAAIVLFWTSSLSLAAQQALRNAVMSRGDVFRDDPSLPGSQLQTYAQWAFLLGTAIMGVAARGVALRLRRTWLAVTIVALFSTAYIFSILPVAVLVFHGWVSPLVAAWLPNVVFATIAMLFVRLKPDTTYSKL